MLQIFIQKSIPKGYPAFGDAIAKTGTEMVYSCEWPLYLHGPKDFQAVQGQFESGSIVYF